eukprot:Skav232869  [mRNA]  locus=scaffold2451:254455:255417:+ [translate_table: standard]
MRWCRASFNFCGQCGYGWSGAAAPRQPSQKANPRQYQPQQGRGWRLCRLATIGLVTEEAAWVPTSTTWRYSGPTAQAEKAPKEGQTEGEETRRGWLDTRTTLDARAHAQNPSGTAFAANASWSFNGPANQTAPCSPPEARSCITAPHRGTRHSSFDADQECEISAVRTLAKAKENLHMCRDARLQLHTSWRSHLADALSRWRKQVDDFQLQDSRLEEETRKAVETLQQARETLEASKEAATKEVGAETIEDDEEDVDTAVPVVGKSIQDGLNNVVESLTTQLQHQADEALQELRKTKRPRTAMDASKVPAGNEHTDTAML